MNKIITILIIVISMVNCDLKTKVSDEIIVNLRKTKNNITFGEYYNSIMASSLLNKYPNYYIDHLKKFKGIPKGDSVFLTTLFFDQSNLKYNLFKMGYLNYNEIQNIDTLKVQKSMQKSINIAIEHKKDTQVLIFDENNNFDFSDDSVVVFDKNFRIEPIDSDKTSKLPTFNLTFKSNYQNRIITHNREVKIYPQSKSIFSDLLDENDLVNKTRIYIEFDDYLKGEFNVNKVDYNIAIQGVIPYLNILINPNSTELSKNDYDINSNFSYKLKDTVLLSEQLYTIDSISDDVSNLYFNKINANKEFFSFRIGHKIKDFQLTGLKYEKFNISEVVKDKKYTIIDFWATWCIPCKELTPELKRISQDYASNMNILSVAFDKNLESVMEYVSKENMDWANSFVKNNKRTGIIEELKIIRYPTFILIDKNRKIISRGSGAKALHEIEKIIKT